MNVNDFDCNALCDLGVSISVMPRKIYDMLSLPLTRVNSTNVLDEGLRIRGIGRRMNSKVKSVKQGVYRK
jgi:hypothetical protein